MEMEHTWKKLWWSNNQDRLGPIHPKLEKGHLLALFFYGSIERSVMGRLILLFLTFAAVSCSQVVPFETLHVDANSTETERLQNLQKVYSVESSQTDNIAFAKSKVVWKEQLFRGTPVKDAWIKMLESNSKSKSLEEFGAQVILGPSSKIDFTLKEVGEELSWPGVIEKDAKWAFPLEESIRSSMRKVKKEYGVFSNFSKN